MEQWINGVWQYLQSPEFQAILTSILAFYAMIRPIINKILSVKSNKALELAKSKYANAKETIDLLMTQIEEYKALAGEVKTVANTLANNASKQNKALALAFDRSNLKEDTKATIANMLPNVDGIINTVSDKFTTAETIITNKVNEVKTVVEPIVEQVKEVVKETNTYVPLRNFDN